jgi:hypothetical protein
MIAVASLLTLRPQHLHSVRNRPCVDSKKLHLRRGATGEMVHLVRQAVIEGRHAYVLVNNRSEGNAPLTVQALTEMLRT